MNRAEPFLFKTEREKAYAAPQKNVPVEGIPLAPLDEMMSS